MGTTPSSNRRAATRAARARQAESGEKYNAARQAATDQPATTADVAPMQLPAPVATMIARHLQAASLHLGTGRRLAEDHGAPIGAPRLNDPSPGPLADAAKQAQRGLWDLRKWATATAAASGVVGTDPGVWPETAEQKAADQALFPHPEQWCQQPGKALPQPGERPEHGPDPQPRVRYSLPGPVPATRLHAYSQGLNVVRAGNVVPGTPAADIWDAHHALYSYMSGWGERDGDSPADLAAAVDGLTEVADTLAEVTAMVLSQIERRTAAGTLTGVQSDQVQQARTELAAVLLRDEDGRYNVLQGAMGILRGALDGAQAVLPAGDGRTMPATLARQMTGKTVAELRADLGHETRWQRHRSKTRAPQYDKADALHRMIQWCHAAGRDTYDPHAHDQDETRNQR